MAQITVFRKTLEKDGRSFDVYKTTLNTRDGEKVYADVCFKKGVTIPDVFPCVVNFEKKDANLQTRETEKEDGTVFINRKLWLNAIGDVEEYIDHSLDDFDL